MNQQRSIKITNIATGLLIFLGLLILGAVTYVYYQRPQYILSNQKCGLQNNNKDCPEDFICYDSYLLGKGASSNLAEKSGDQRCHKRCTTFIDCGGVAKCVQKEVSRGDTGQLERFCDSVL